LGLTGLFVKYGRDYIAPLVGKDANAALLLASKFVHNNVAWAFMIALVMIFVMWVWHNIPNRTDITWFAQAGGIVGSAHPPAKKFNGGQKIIFWSVIVLGGSISVSGLSLLFPFELPLFAKTFTILNDWGVPGLLGIDMLPTVLAPQEEMQLAQAWHAIVSFVLMAIIIAHIYIGSIGMQGAYDAMGSGEVDEAWAHQHHSIWLEEVKARQAKASPAE
jgi:formate dehydrogenase subunit gamma